MENIAQMITQPGMVWIFVGFILLVALRPLYQAIFSIGIVDQDLDRATNVLMQLGKNQQDEFYNQFRTINGKILKIPGLRHAWREFVDSMYFENAALPTPHKKVYLSHRPSHYFDRNSVLGTRLNLSQFLAYPNYLIGIGLTLTFIGLAAALHVAQAGLANGAGQEALKELLAVASVKFISSIAGIASSLVISAIQRARLRVFQQKLDAFCDLLEECTKYKSTEKLLHDSLNEQRTQTALLGDMGKNVAVGINEVISRELSASIATALEPLTQEIRLLAGHFAEGSESALRKMLAEFVSALHKTTAGDIQELMDSVVILKDSLGELAANIQQLGKNFDSDVKVSASHLAEMLEHFVTSFTSVQHGIMQFGHSLSSLESVAGRVERAGGSMESAADDNKKAAREFEEAVADITAKLTPMGKSLTSLSQSLQGVEETAVNLKQAGGAIAAAAGEFKSSAEIIGQSEDKFGREMGIFEHLAQEIARATAILERVSPAEGAAITLKKNGNNYFSKLKSRWLK